MNPDRSAYPVLVLLIVILLFLPVSCNNRQQNIVQNKMPGPKEMEGVNIYLVEKDRERILNYIERRNLEMTESPSGLWYQIKKEGSGDFFREKSKVVMEFECSLLDGTKCYSSKDSGPKTVIIGKSTIEPGLNEGLKLLKPGGEALFIIPPYLAWGLPGDGKAIPPRAIVVYEIRIVAPSGE